MSEKYRVVVELYTDSNPNIVERKVIEDRTVSPVETIYDLGLRHKDQIGVLCGKGQFFSQGVSSPLFIRATENELISKL